MLLAGLAFLVTSVVKQLGAKAMKDYLDIRGLVSSSGAQTRCSKAALSCCACHTLVLCMPAHPQFLLLCTEPLTCQRDCLQCTELLYAVMLRQGLCASQYRLKTGE